MHCHADIQDLVLLTTLITNGATAINEIYLQCLGEKGDLDVRDNSDWIKVNSELLRLSFTICRKSMACVCVCMGTARRRNHYSGLSLRDVI